MRDTHMDVAHARVTVVQGHFFPATPSEVCTRLGLNWWAAVKLHETGWLSFDPQKIEKLAEDQEAELIFVGSLVAGGCDEAMLKQMLAGLEKPYRYRAHQIYFDWVAKEWRLLPVREEPDPDAVFSWWIDDLVQHGEIDKIVELKEIILASEKECNELLEEEGAEAMRWEAEQAAKREATRAPAGPA